MEVWTLKDVEWINNYIKKDKADKEYNNESRLLRKIYQPRSNKSKILIEISSYYDASGSNSDKWESEIHISENKNHYTDSKGGTRLSIRKFKFMSSGGGARINPFFQTGIFTNSNTNPKYFHFNVKRDGADDHFRLGRGYNNTFSKWEGTLKITEYAR
jgi:hypothetical protein